jgi:Putative prokaryotic signal transducing protein
MSEREPLVTVRTAKYMEAQIVKGRLESEGIPVLLKYESAGLVYGVTVDGLGEVKIMVPKHLAEEARGILEISLESKK